MCGIAGLVGSTLSCSQIRHHLRLASQALRHRGPDDEGYYVDQDAALGISRLAIRDPEKGIQPMQREGVVIVFNGELYETQPLKDRLLSRGYQFETECDTEILLNAFLEFGPEILTELDGMFAFAIWDSRKKELFLARDRWGEKPLYYTLGEGSLAFASEIKSLRAWPNINWDIHLPDLHLFLKYSYIPHPNTGWKNIFKLEPGFFLVWREGRLSKRRYFTPQIKAEKKSSEELFHLLSLSVKQCLVSDRPVGAFLSGGIDSTTIAYFLSQFQPGAPVFSLIWDDSNYSEEHYAKEAASALGLPHLSVKCDASFFLDHFDAIASLYDEPFADESMIPTFCLARFAKKEVDVVLTGDGSDEFFHGYERYFFKGDFEQYLDVFAATSKKTHALICEPDFLALEPQNPFLTQYLMDKESVSEDRLRSFIDIKTYLTDDILMKVDRASMGVGLEARAPFLTPRVTDFALQCSMDYLVGRNNRGKEILRSAMKGSLPQITVERKKMGFGVPLNDWFRTSLKEWMKVRLLEGELLKSGWFSERGVQELIASHLSGRGQYARTLFNLLVLEAWFVRNRSQLLYLTTH